MNDTSGELFDHDQAWETNCDGSADGKYCAHWYDGERCCQCGEV